MSNDRPIRKRVSEAQAAGILKLMPNDITLDWLRSNFANFKDSKPVYNPQDEMIASKDRIFKLAELPKMTPAFAPNFGDKDVITTVGRYVVNLFIFGGSENMRSVTPYVNEPMTGDYIEKMGSLVANLFTEEKINSEEYIDYINRLFWIGYSPTSFLASSYDYGSTISLPNVMKRKAELLKKHAGHLDSATVQAIEKELCDMAREELTKRDVGGMDLYNSGFSGRAFNTGYKNTSIMRGMIPQSDDASILTLSDTALVDGTKKEETHLYADLVTSAAFSTAVGTQIGGYETKKMNAAFQSVVTDEPGTDCGTKYGYTTKFNDKGKSDFYMRYIIEGGKLILLDSAALDKYVGKNVTVRSPLYCLSDAICSKCAGELYYKMGIRNIGLLCNRASASLMNANLKKRHDLSVKTKRLNLSDHIVEVKK